MKMSKTLLIATTATGIALSGIVGTAIVSADTPADKDGPTGLIEKIATKFNLNKDEVKAVFEADRAEHEADRQAKMEERLAKAVTDGKITAEQKSKILAKVKELQAKRDANREAVKEKNAEERKAAMETERTALEQWAKDNNISMEYLHFGRGPGGPDHGGPRGFGGEQSDMAPPATEN